MTFNGLLSIKHLPAITLLLTLVACKTTPSILGGSPLQAPPGTVEIAPNLFFDRTEITNLDYREFMYWTKQVYGGNSEEARKVQPDTTVWSELEGHFEPFASRYFTHPAYNHYPVAGVSYEQAQAYSGWRSDRVMQMYLIESGKIEAHFDKSPETAFTIERYFTGQYRDYKPDPEVVLYPHYSLPDAETYRKVVSFADSLNTVNYSKCHEKNCSENHLIACGEDGPSQNSFLPKLTNCANCKGILITHLQDNVREIMAEPRMLFGGSYGSSCSTESVKLIQVSPDAYTGFRNRCTYKRWEGGSTPFN